MLGCLRNLVNRIVAEVKSCLWIKAEYHRAAGISIIINGAVMATVTGNHGITLGQGTASQRIEELTIISVAALEVETTIPVVRQAQMKTDSVVLTVYRTDSWVDVTDDLAVVYGVRLGRRLALTRRHTIKSPISQVEGFEVVNVTRRSMQRCWA
jgi:hypothetical protein